MIAERAGGLSGRNRRTGKFRNREVDSLRRKVRYLLSPDTRCQGLVPGQRVAHFEAMQVIAPTSEGDPERYAEAFTAALEEWNHMVRGEEKASQNLCIDRSFSFAPDDPVDPIEAVMIVEDLIERVMGRETRLALYVVHTDKPHLHVHVIASVVDCRGNIFNPRNDDALWEEDLSDVERDYGLKQVPRWIGTPRRGSGIPASSVKHVAATRRTPQKDALRDAIESVVAEAQGVFPRFLRALDRHLILPVARQRGEAPTAPVTGISFYCDGELFTGSQLSRDLAWPTLLKRVGYDPVQHQASLLARTQQYQIASQGLCTIKPVSPTTIGPDVIELPYKTQVKRKRQLLHKPVRQPSDRVHHWRGGGEIFRENSIVNPRTTGPQRGSHNRISQAIELGSNLATENGTKRSVIKRMLLRAWQLGWQHLVVEGSTEFVRLAKALCRDWLGGHVHDRQPKRANDPKAAAITTSPSTPPTPDPLVPPHSRENDLRMEPGRAGNMKPRTTVTPPQKPRRVEEEPAVEVVVVPVEPSLEEELIPEVVIEPDSQTDLLSPVVRPKPETVPRPVKVKGSPDRRYPVRGRRQIRESDSGPSM